MSEFLSSVFTWLNDTHLPEQVREVDIKGLFQNPYFLVPFILLILYFLYKQAFNNLITTGVILGLWWFSGTDMVRGALVDGEIQLEKILPVIAVSIGGIGILVYLFFIKQD